MGIGGLRDEVDTLIVIPNDRLLSISDRQVSVLDAFHSADQVLLSGVQGITDLITTPGLINLDFADVKSVMSGAGSALMGIGSARGDDRAIVAAESAIASPLLEASVEGAHGVLMNISGGSDLGLFEINEAAQLVADAAHPDANIIFGAVIDDALGDEVRVTVIAAGFDGGAPRPRTVQQPRRQPARPTASTDRVEPEFEPSVGLAEPGLPADPADPTGPDAGPDEPAAHRGAPLRPQPSPTS
jgi:cell division protein FtsZ